MGSIINFVKTVLAKVWMRTVGGKGEFSQLLETTAISIPGDLSKAVCAELVARIDGIVDTPGHPRVWVDALGSDARIFGFEHEIPDVLDHFNLRRRISAVDAYTGRGTNAWFLMANRVTAKDGNLGSGGGMHRDSPFSNQVKCIWYLTDVSSDEGPFRFVPGSHLNVFETRGVYPLGSSRFDDVADDMVEVHAPAGTLLVCDTKCIHGGKPLESGARYAVTLYTLPSAESAFDLLVRSTIDPTLAVQRLPVP